MKFNSPNIAQMMQCNLNSNLHNFSTDRIYKDIPESSRNMHNPKKNRRKLSF